MDLENLVSRTKWQEEEDDADDVKDNWDDEDEEPPKPAPVAPKKSTNTKKAAASKTIDDATSSTSKPLTDREKRLLEEKLQKESDLKLTKQMLGVMEDKDIKLEFALNTKEDFDQFHKNLVHKLWCYDKSPHYYLLLDKLIRDLCAPLETDELKNLSSALNALFNEKVKISKASKPKKKAAKVAIKMERNNLDDFVDELDDIM